jgi:hypothetical protein
VGGGRPFPGTGGGVAGPPPTGPTFGVDLSSARLTLEAARCLKANGWGRVTVGIRYDNLALTRSNLQVAKDAGLEVDAYAYYWLGGDVRDRTRRSLDLCLPYDITQLWPDWEDNGHGAAGVPNRAEFPPSRVCDLIAAVDDEMRNYFPPSKYSGAWWWTPATGNSTRWAGDEWWIAQYDGIPDLSVFTPFGGITRLVGKQYQGTTSECGVTVDLNLWR